MSSTDIRQYAAEAQSTDTFGRVLCSARNHHFVIDGPVQNGCPGEAVTPPEAFLTGVAACGVELVEVIARELGLPIPTARVRIEGIVDRSRPVRTDVTVFNSVRIQFSIGGVTRDQATDLVDRFKKR
ncbi:MAG TPA: OsmC family protein [Thermoanaerobaculia bacterium]|nr:OsmC family protein [Thermoanaerobaculia bacterium]